MGAAWSPQRLLEAFGEHATSADARTWVRVVAARYGAVDLVDDLAQEWFARMIAVLERKIAHGDRLTGITGEDDARAYFYRALVNTAIDLVRPRRIDQPWSDAPESVDPLSLGDRCELDAVVETVRQRLRSELGPTTPGGERSHLVAAVALAIVEIGTGRVVVTRQDRAGGSDEWDRLVQQAIALVCPDLARDATRWSSPNVRALRSRLGRAARRLLKLTFEDLGFGPAGELLTG